MPPLKKGNVPFIDKTLDGSTHFLVKRLPNVQTEMSLHVLAYNLTRAINVVGVPKIIEQLQAA